MKKYVLSRYTTGQELLKDLSSHFGEISDDDGHISATMIYARYHNIIENEENLTTVPREFLCKLLHVKDQKF